MMTRRILGLGVALILASTVLAGCDLFHNQLRSKSTDVDDEDHVDHVEHEDDDSESKSKPVDSKPTKGFFHATRLPGALSDEGRDIERNLGIP